MNRTFLCFFSAALLVGCGKAPLNATDDPAPSGVEVDLAEVTPEGTAAPRRVPGRLLGLALLYPLSTNPVAHLSVQARQDEGLRASDFEVRLWSGTEELAHLAPADSPLQVITNGPGDGIAHVRFSFVNSTRAPISAIDVTFRGHRIHQDATPLAARGIHGNVVHVIPDETGTPP